MITFHVSLVVFGDDGVRFLLEDLHLDTIGQIQTPSPQSVGDIENVCQVLPVRSDRNGGDGVSIRVD